MASPFDFREMSSRAEAMAARLRSAEEFRDDLWADAALGPLLRIYALLTYFSDEAFSEPCSAERLAECRLYAYARMARLHAKRDGCDCMEVDGLDELMTEFDQLEGADIMGALQAGNADANRQFAKLKKSGNAEALEH